MSELPESWIEASIADVTAPFASIDPAKTPEKTFRYVDIGSIDNKTQTIADVKTVSGREAPSRARRVIGAGDTLFSTVRTYLRNIAIVPEELDGELTSTGIAVLRPNGAVDGGYLFRWACSDKFVDTLSGAQDGTMYPAVSDRDVVTASIPLPPLPEQRRIVTKIDRLTGKSRRARDHLDHIPRLVEKYKQAVLAAAFRGDLTQGWRDVGAATSDPRGIDGRLTALGVLPAGWSWTSMDSVAQITGGLTKNSSRNVLPLRVPYLRVANVYANELRLDEITEIGCTEAEYRRTMLRSGDLLIVEGNGSLGQIGRVALWGDEHQGCSHQNHLIRARMGGDVIPSYALFWLLSPQGRTSIELVASSSSGLHTLSISKVRGLPIPICSKALQDEVVRRIRSAFVWIDRLASEATSARSLVDRLDQAVLTKAFQGELVPQDPTDKPANGLLKRIRAEREAAPKAKRGRKASAHG